MISSVADTAAPVKETPKQEAAKDAAKDAAENNGKKLSWIPPAIAGAVFVAGGIMAAAYNNKAKRESEKETNSLDEYNDRHDKIESAQTMRTVGLAIGAAGLVGLGITLLF